MAGAVRKYQHAGLPAVIATNLRTFVMKQQRSGKMASLLLHHEHDYQQQQQQQLTFSASASGGHTSQPSGRQTRAPLQDNHAAAITTTPTHNNNTNTTSIDAINVTCTLVQPASVAIVNTHHSGSCTHEYLLLSSI